MKLMQKMDTKKILKAESSAWLAANQRAKSAETGAEKWYSGSKPTARETIARIHTVADGDKDTFNNLYSKFLTAQNTKGSTYYNPYTKATNSKAIDGLAGLGIDVSGGITQDFLDQYAGLRNYDRTASGYSPLAPTKSSTPEQNAAYYFNQLQDAEPTTQAAEQEWAQMQKELTYWANRGLSDEEAIAKLDWKNYKTLAKMDEKKSTGDALILNRPVGYSSDAMYGTLWAARNNGGTGNALADMANSARGVGNVYKRDAFAEDQRNPASKNYNPYTRATIDSALINLGVDKIDDEWLAANRSMLATDQADLYRDLYAINEDTKVAQAEYALLQKNVDRWLKAGYSAEDIARVFEEDADNEYGTLKKMDEARLLGKPYALGDAVNYRWEDVYEYARQKRAELDAPIDVQAEARKEEYINKNGSLTSGDTRETTIAPQIVAEPESPKEIEEAADKWLELPQEYDNPLDTMDARIALEQAEEPEQAETGASKLPEGAKVVAGAGASDVVFTSTNQTRTDEIDATLANIEAELDGLPDGEYKAALEQQKRELEAEKISLQVARTNEMRDDLGADPIDPPENRYNPPKADSEAAVTPDGGTNRVDKIDETLANIEAELVDLPDGEYKNAIEQQKRELEAERISLQGDAANKMRVEEKTDLQLDTKIADYQTVSQQIADLESTTEVDPEVLADIDAQREELKQELANNQIDKAMYDKLMKRVDERLAFWQETAEEENRPEREKLTAEKDRLEGELLDVIRSKDATDPEKVSAAATIGAWDAAAKYQFNAIKEKLSANAEYSKFLEANGGAQAAAKVLCSYVLAGEDLKNLESLDEATRAELEKYQTFCEEALGLYEDKELYNFLDAALGGALKNTKYNEGIGLFNTLAFGVGMGAAQFNDVLGDVAGALITAYGYVMEGSEWLCEQLGLGNAKYSEKVKKAGTAVSSYYDKQYAKLDQYLLENASTLEYFTARATAEGTKMAGEVVLGTGLAGSAKTAAMGTLKTGAEALKLEQTVKYLGQVPFLLESGFGTGMDTYEQTGSVLRSIGAGMASAMATAVTSDLGVLSKMDDIGAPFVQSVIDKVASVPGSGTMAALKRWGIASVQFSTNLLKTGNGEGLQEVVEYVLSEPVIYALQEGKSFLSKGLAEIGAEAVGNYIWGALSSFGATMQTLPSYARSVVAAEGMMGNSKLTPKDVVDLVEAYLADLNDPAVVAAMEKNAEQDAVEVQTGLLIAQDTGLQSLIEASEDAKEAAVQAVASAEAADAALDEAQSAVQENPSPETAQAYKEALADQTQAAAKAEQATAQSDKAAQKAAEGLAQKRSEAKSMIGLIQQSLAEQREAAKQVQAEQREAAKADVAQTETEITSEPDNSVEPADSTGGEASVESTSGSSIPEPFGPQKRFGSKTAQESNLLSEDTKKWLYYNSGYVKDSNRAQISRAVKDIEAKGGYSAAKEAWLSEKASHQNTADGQVTGMVLMALAAYNGDLDGEVAIADRINDLGLISGQAQQARKVFQRMTSAGMATLVQKQVTKLNERFARQNRPVTVQTNPETMHEILTAKDADSRQAAVDKALKEIAEQVPPTWADRLVAFRYTALLGNVRTVTRNFLGNAAFTGVVRTKDQLGAVLEAIAEKAGWIEQRTKAVGLTGNEYQMFAKTDAEDHKEWLTGQERYSTEKDVIEKNRRSFGNSALGKALQKYSDVTRDLMEGGDWVFIKKHYTHALAGWLQANNISLDMLEDIQNAETKSEQAKAYTEKKYVPKKDFAPGTVVLAKDRDSFGKIVGKVGESAYKVHFVSPYGSEATVSLDADLLIPTKGAGVSKYVVDWETATPSDILEVARNYAYDEAMRATFRDVSQFAKLLGRLKYKGGDPVNGVSLPQYVLTEGAMAFKSTPVNVLRRGIEYSPAGLITVIAKWGKQCYDMNKAQANLDATGDAGKFNPEDRRVMTANQFIDGLAAGLTGTAAFALGMLLSSLGLIVGKLGDDNDDKFKKQLGVQDYSVNLFGHNVTIDWLSPGALPVFAGAAAYDHAQEHGWSLSSLWNGLMAIAEPAFGLSMLDGINDLIDSAQYAKENGVTSIAVSATINFLGQFLPSILGQLARTVDPVRRTVTTDSSSSVPSEIQYAIGTWANKIPGLSVLNEPYIDLWGEPDKPNNATEFAMNALEQFILPGYTNRIDPDDTEEYLMALADIVGPGVYPTTVAKTFTVDGVEHKLTGKELTEYRAFVGQTRKRYLDALVKDPAFLALAPKYQAKAIDWAYDLALKVGKKRIDPGVNFTEAETQVVAASKGDKTEAVVDYLVGKADKAQTDDYVSAYKGQLEKSLLTDDADVYNQSFGALLLADIKESDIKKYVIKKGKELYTEAWAVGDLATCAKIQNRLVAAGVIADFNAWEDEAMSTGSK